jgi:hypothetical protein
MSSHVGGQHTGPVTPNGPSGEYPVIELQLWEALGGTMKTMAIEDHVVAVNIPAGVKDGTLLRLPRQGTAGPDGERPDLVVRVRITEQQSAPPTATRSKSAMRKLAVVGALALVVAVVIAIVTAPGPTEPPAAVPASTPSSAGTVYQAVPTPTETRASEPDPFDGIGERDCLHNYGSAGKPNMLAAACTAGNYRILTRRWATVDRSACDLVAGTTHDYVVELYDVTYRGIVEIRRSLNLTRSYVFCLQEIG